VHHCLQQAFLFAFALFCKAYTGIRGDAVYPGFQ